MVPLHYIKPVRKPHTLQDPWRRLLKSIHPGAITSANQLALDKLEQALTKERKGAINEDRIWEILFGIWVPIDYL